MTEASILTPAGGPVMEAMKARSPAGVVGYAGEAQGRPHGEPALGFQVEHGLGDAAHAARKRYVRAGRGDSEPADAQAVLREIVSEAGGDAADRRVAAFVPQRARLPRLKDDVAVVQLGVEHGQVQEHPAAAVLVLDAAAGHHDVIHLEGGRTPAGLPRAGEVVAAILGEHRVDERVRDGGVLDEEIALQKLAEAEVDPHLGGAEDGRQFRVGGGSEDHVAERGRDLEDVVIEARGFQLDAERPQILADFIENEVAVERLGGSRDGEQNSHPGADHIQPSAGYRAFRSDLTLAASGALGASLRNIWKCEVTLSGRLRPL